MTATFTNQPGVRDIDTVRVEIDDKDCTPETDAILTDEEIQYYIDNNAHILLASAAAADAVASKYSDDAKSKTVGDLRIDYGEGRAASYTTRAASLRQRAYRKAAGKVYAGGISVSDKRKRESDTDRVPSEITIGMDDNETSNASVRGVMDY
jgi:hypothetical protein